jgi:alpha-amylase/alpha-mannosidase (GH57 family)
LEQLQDYANGTAIDRHWALTLTPVTQLTAEQKREILQQFFDVNPRTQILPHPRYQALYEQRQTEGVDWCLRHWQPEDFSDLLAWYNLIWFDPLTVAEDRDLQQWYFQQHAFSLGDRQRIISKQRQIIQTIIPLHQALQKRCQLEIMTSPYSHPILPLLADTNIARTCQANLPLPDPRFCWSEDSIQQLQKAKQSYQQTFGRNARGLWSPALATSPSMLGTATQLRFDWVCGDETVLAHCLNQSPQDQHQDRVGGGARSWLYHPYRLRTLDGDLTLVFRDQRLSDQLRFDYAHLSPARAVQDLMAQLLSLYQGQSSLNLGQSGTETPRLVTLALEGEQGWANYDQNGFGFLSQFYQQSQALTRQGILQFVTVSEFIDQFPQAQIATHGIQEQLTGAWRQGDFSPWIGSPLKNKAWDYLIDARQTLANHPEATPDNNPAAWNALYAAQSSDWFEALNHDMTPRQCQLEALFRSHLIQLYRALNETIPGYLQHPLGPAIPTKTDRQGSLYPRWGDLSDLTSWQGATCVSVTQHQVVRAFYYGQNPHFLYFRLDCHCPIELVDPDELHLWWYYPGVPHPNAPAAIASLPDHAPLNYYFHHHCWVNLKSQQAWHEVALNRATWQRSSQRPEVIRQDQIFVVSVPVDLLAHPGNPTLHLLVLLAEQGEFDSLLSGDRPLEWHCD